MIIVAGRDASKFYDHITEKNPIFQIEKFELGSFEMVDFKNYIEHKEKQFQIKLEDDVRDKLEILSMGKPILIDMAFAWTVQYFQPDWLASYSKKYLKKIFVDDNEDKEKYKEEIDNILSKFEYDLVKDLGKRGIVMEKLILILSRVIHLDIPMITYYMFLNKENYTNNEKAQAEEKAKSLYNEAVKKVYIKELPNNEIQLHDEFRRIINERFWPLEDPEKADIINYHKKAAEYYMAKIVEYDSIDKSDLPNLESVDRIQQENKISIILRRYLTHVLEYDLEAGFNFFILRFDEALKLSQDSRMLFLCERIGQYVEKFDEEKRFQIEIRRGNYFLKKGLYEKTEEISKIMIEISTKMIEKKYKDPLELAESMILDGNNRMRLADYTGGINRFREAVKICEEQDFGETERHNRLKMQAHLALGWGYRLLNNYSGAKNEYDKALLISVDMGDEIAQVKILNNMGFVACRTGNRGGALQLEDEVRRILEKHSLEIKEKNEEVLEQYGAYYHVMTEIFINSDDDDDAIHYIKQALDIFHSINHQDWINRMEFTKGRIYWLWADQNRLAGIINEDTINLINKAEEILITTVDQSMGRNRINALHYLGHTYLTWSMIDEKKKKIYREKAYKYFMTSYTEAGKSSFNSMELNSMGDIVYINNLNGKFDEVKEYENRYSEFLQKWKDFGYALIWEGYLLKYFGDAALESNPPKLEKAFDNYISGIRIIGLYDDIPSYSLPHHLNDIVKRINRLCEKRSKFADRYRKLMQNLGDVLYHIWKQDEKLETKYPNSIRQFLTWSKG